MIWYSDIDPSNPNEYQRDYYWFHPDDSRYVLDR